MTTRPPRANDDGLGRLEERRLASVNLVQAIYRLTKACQLYDDANQTVQQTVGPAVDSVATYCSLYEADVVRVLFSSELVLVNRRMLRASREAFTLALHVGGLLAPLDLNEIAFERGATRDATLRFFRALVDAQRSPALVAAMSEGRGTMVSARKAVGPDAELDFDPSESPISRVVKSYAASILILQTFYSQFSKGEHRGARDVKRVAQKLVAMSDEHPELLTACAASPLSDDDVARRAVGTAVFALVMARTLTQERAVLSTIALAALLADAGMASKQDAEMQGARSATSSLIALSAMGQYYAASIRRNVVVFESLVLSSPTAALYDGVMQPTSLSSMLFVARQFNELRTPRSGREGLGIDEAIRKLESVCVTPIDRTFLRLLIVSLGFYPTRTVVELDTGEIAMVVGAPRVALDFARPPVQVLTDAAKKMLSKPFEIDLARQPRGQPSRSIRRLGSVAQ